jgi:hypothetical protein
MKTTTMTVEEMEAEIKRMKAVEAEEAARLEALYKAAEVKLNMENQQNSMLRDMQIRMQSIKDSVGDLIHDPDFLWFMISLILTTRDEVRLQVRPGVNNNFTGNSFTANLVEAYKRNRSKII